MITSYRPNTMKSRLQKDVAVGSVIAFAGLLVLLGWFAAAFVWAVAASWAVVLWDSLEG
jgi:hypothetical protein